MDESPNDGYNLADVQSLLGLPPGSDLKTPVRPRAPPQAQPPVTPSAPPSEDADPAANNLLAYLRVRRETSSSRAANNGYVTEPPLPTELPGSETPASEDDISGPRHGIPRFADTALSVSPDVPLPDRTASSVKPRSVSDTTMESGRNSSHDLGLESKPLQSPVVHRPDSDEGSPRSGTSETSNDHKQHRAASRYTSADSSTPSRPTSTEPSATTGANESKEVVGDTKLPMITVTAHPEEEEEDYDEEDEEISHDNNTEREASHVSNELAGDSNVPHLDTSSSSSSSKAVEALTTEKAVAFEAVATSSITNGGIGGGLAVSGGRNGSAYSVRREENHEAVVLNLAHGRVVTARQVKMQQGSQASTTSVAPPASMLPSTRADRVLAGFASEDAAAEAAAEAAVLAVVRQQEKVARKAARKAAREQEAQRLAAYDAIERSSPFQHMAAAVMLGQQLTENSNHNTVGAGSNNSNGDGSSGLGNDSAPENSFSGSGDGTSSSNINLLPAIRKEPEAMLVCLPCLLIDAPLVGRLVQRCAVAITSYGRVLILQRLHASTALLGTQSMPGSSSSSSLSASQLGGNSSSSNGPTSGTTATAAGNSQGACTQQHSNSHRHSPASTAAGRAAVAKATNPRAVVAAQVGTAAAFQPEAPSEQAEEVAARAQVPLAMHRHLRHQSVATSTTSALGHHNSFTDFPPAGKSPLVILDALAAQCGSWSDLDGSTAAAYPKTSVHGAALQTFHGTTMRRGGGSGSVWLRGLLGGAPYVSWLASLWIWVVLVLIAVGQSPSSGASWLLFASAMAVLVAIAAKLWQWHQMDAKAKTSSSFSASPPSSATRTESAAAAAASSTSTTTTGTALSSPSAHAPSSTTNQPAVAVMPSAAPSTTTSTAGHKGARYCDVQTLKVEATSSVTAACALALVVAVASLETASAFLALFGALISWSYVVWAYRSQEGGALDAQHPLVQYALIPMDQAWATCCSCQGHSYQSSLSQPSSSPSALRRPALEVAAEWCAVVSEASAALTLPPPHAAAAGAAPSALNGVSGDRATGMSSNFEVWSWTVVQLTLELAGGNQVVAILDPSAEAYCKPEAPQNESATSPPVNHGTNGNEPPVNTVKINGNRSVIEAAYLAVELLTSGTEEV